MLILNESSTFLRMKSWGEYAKGLVMACKRMRRIGVMIKVHNNFSANGLQIISTYNCLMANPSNMEEPIKLTKIHLHIKS